MAQVVEQVKPVRKIAIECIRDELRDELHFSRKIKREQKQNQNRIALGALLSSYNNRYDVEFIIETAKNLKKKSMSIQEYGNLQDALLQNEYNINAFLSVDNVVHCLSRDLSGSSTQAKLAAANICCNVALGNHKACVALCKFTAPYLIAELENNILFQPLAEVCAWTIGNLVSGSDKAFRILHAQDCIKSLINLARECPDSLLPAISYASLRYIYAGGDSIEISDIIKFAEILSTRYPTVSDEDTMWLLALLSSKAECLEHIIKCAPTVCDFLFQAVNNRDEDIKRTSAALRIICNTISEPTGHVALCLLENEIEETCSFLDELLNYEYTHIIYETLWLIGNLYNHCLVTVQKTAEQLVMALPALKDVMKSFNEQLFNEKPFSKQT